jgi:hypothetical protein
MIIIIAVMSFLTRACGAAWNRIPQLEIAFAAPFGYVAYLSSGSPLVGLLGWIISYAGFQLGHGNFYQMRGVDITNDKPEHIESLARKIYPNIYTPAYSWICMGFKGLIIGLAAFPFGLLLGLLWPAAYFLGWKLQKNDSATAEFLAGAFAGLILWVSL